jgi:cytochrome c
MRSKIISVLVLVVGSMISALVVSADNKADVAAGRAAFEKRCTGCHALDHDKEGPRLAGVLQRKAGSVPGFPYSDAVKKSAVVWNEGLIDKWLTDPDSVIPDSDMAFRLSSSTERAAIIAFLKGTGK